MKKMAAIIVAAMMLISCGAAVAGDRIGEEGRLSSGGELTPVASSEKAFDEWTSASVANDKEGHVLLLASGRVFAVKRGTKVRVIDQVCSLL